MHFVWKKVILFTVKNLCINSADMFLLAKYKKEVHQEYGSDLARDHISLFSYIPYIKQHNHEGPRIDTSNSGPTSQVACIDITLIVVLHHQVACIDTL